MSAIRHSNKNLDRVKGSIEKLVTGLRINKGADDPANLIASERMRSNIAEIKQTHDNFEMAGSIYQHAEGSLNEISDILIRLKQLAVHATNEAVNDDAILETDQQEVDDLLATGGTAEAAVNLIEKCGGRVHHCCFVVNLPDLGGKNRLQELGRSIFTVCEFEGE